MDETPKLDNEIKQKEENIQSQPAQRESKFNSPQARLVGAIFIIIGLLPVVIIAALLIAVFTYQKYDINATKEKWSQAENSLPDYYKFEMVGEDKSQGTVFIEYQDYRFGYKCVRERQYAIPTNNFNCYYVVGSYSSPGFSLVLYSMHKEEIYNLVNDIPGIAVDEPEYYLLIESEDEQEQKQILLSFRDRLLEIKDYEVYFEHVLQQYRREPNSVHTGRMYIRRGDKTKTSPLLQALLELDQ